MAHTNKIENMLNSMVGNWYGEHQDIFVELNKMDVDVFEATAEYISAGYTDKEEDEDVQIMIRLGGTESTITIESIEEVYRG